MPAPKPTIRSALKAACERLQHSDTAAVDAQVLLAYVLGVDRSYLFAHGERQLEPAQLRAFQAMCQRRANGEPIAYIIGECGFYDLDLAVAPAVLIPRPETELLLEEALRLTPSDSPARVADIGTGSGALALAFKRQRPSCQVFATDISCDALLIARQNAARYDADVAFLAGDLAQPLIDRRLQVEMLMANLPYISSDALAGLAVSRWEPRLALDGGADGLRLIAGLVAQLPAVCLPGARVLLEIGADQGPAVAQLVRDCLGLEAAILQDYAGLDRIIHFAMP